MNQYKWMLDVLMDMAVFAENNGLQKSYDTLVNSVIEVMIEIGPVEHLSENIMVSEDFVAENNTLPTG